MKQLWIVVYQHRHGTDAWPVWGESPPSLEKVASELDDFEPDREYLSLSGPFDDSGSGDYELLRQPFISTSHTLKR